MRMTCVSLKSIQDVSNARLAPHMPVNAGYCGCKIRFIDVRTLLDAVLVRSFVILVLLSSSYTLCAGIIFLLVVVALL